METSTNRIWIGMMILLLGLAGVGRAEDLGTVFSYQGRLETAGSPPLNGSYDFEFRVYDTDEVGTGTPIGMIMEEPNIPVTEGIFTVQLNPDPTGTNPNLFNGEVRYLEIAVRKTGSAEPFYTISPRQRIHAAPYAITASSARWLRAKNSTEKVVYVDDSGNVGIGTEMPGTNLHVANVENNVSIAIENSTYNTLNASAALEFRGRAMGLTGAAGKIVSERIGPYNEAAYTHHADLAFYTALYDCNYERLRISHNGNVGISTTSPTERLDVDGNARIRQMPAAGIEMAYVMIDANGNFWWQVSSKRYKDNIEDLEIDTEKLLNLRPVSFRCKNTGMEGVGLIAEEVAEQIKDLVLYDKEDRPKAVKYDRVGVYLLAVVKELKAENELLKEKVQVLEKAIQQFHKPKKL